MRQCAKQFVAPVKQGAVGCEHRTEAFLSRHGDEIRQQRVQQRFAHEVKVQEYHLPTDSFREQVKLFQRQLSLRPGMFRAEVAVEVADVRYLYVAAVDQIEN